MPDSNEELPRFMVVGDMVGYVRRVSQDVFTVLDTKFMRVSMAYDTRAKADRMLQKINNREVVIHEVLWFKLPAAGPTRPRPLGAVECQYTHEEVREIARRALR